MRYSHSHKITHHRYLFRRFKISDLPDIILKRRLNWLHRIANLPSSSPRRALLDAGSPYPPPPYRKRNLLPQAYINDLKTAGLHPDSWLHVFQDKDQWRDFTATLPAFAPKPARQPRARMATADDSSWEANP